MHVLHWLYLLLWCTRFVLKYTEFLHRCAPGNISRSGWDPSAIYVERLYYCKYDYFGCLLRSSALVAEASCRPAVLTLYSVMSNCKLHITTHLHQPFLICLRVCSDGFGDQDILMCFMWRLVAFWVVRKGPSKTSSVSPIFTNTSISHSCARSQ